MKKFRFLIFVGFIMGSLLVSCGLRNTDYKDHLKFSNIDSVQTVIKEMDILLHKLPLSPEFKLKHYHIRKDGSLIINGEIINSIKNLSIDDFRKNHIFSELPDIEKIKLLENILYLYKNDIKDAKQSECFWQFGYLYKSNYLDEYYSYRTIIAVYNPTDTSNAFFKYQYQIIDRERDLILYKSNIYTRYNPPDYEKIKNPYDSLD
jgi:hypothetical protein